MLVWLWTMIWMHSKTTRLQLWDWYSNRQTDRDKHTQRQMDRQADRQTDGWMAKVKDTEWERDRSVSQSVRPEVLYGELLQGGGGDPVGGVRLRGPDHALPLVWRQVQEVLQRTHTQQHHHQHHHQDTVITSCVIWCSSRWLPWLRCWACWGWVGWGWPRRARRRPSPCARCGPSPSLAPGRTRRPSGAPAARPS